MRLSLIAALLLLAACTDNKMDYEASAKCQSLGHKPGTAAYDECVSEVRSERLLQQQRREYEQMKQYDRDYKTRGY